MNFLYKIPKAPLLLIALIVLAALAYWPGLSGGFVYDDWSSITGNSNVQIKVGSWAEWSRSALSFPSGTPPFRSLGMMSFAANHLFGGLDPFGFKIANLAIHLLNGLLLFLALRTLFALRLACGFQSARTSSFDGGLAAAALAGIWLILPINLTAVLYVVQRLESLATTFIFLGLAWYLRARLLHWRGEGRGVGLWLSIGTCTLLGILCKEVGVMLPLYAALIEFSITGGRNRDGKLSRSILALYGLTLLLPFLIGMIWMWGRFIGPGSLEAGSYALTRLMTEARIIVDYVIWILAPSLDSLTLYHDDIALSKGLLSPASTLFSIVALTAWLVAALWLRRRRPLFTLGTLWFFAGHLLTGTIVPLILAFEHRNYFSSAGLLLAAASLITLEGGVHHARTRIAAVAVVTVFYAGTLWMRAQEWSDPMRLARTEAIKRPGSPSAQYDYAQALIMLGARTSQSQPVTIALKLLDSARELPGASTHFEQTIIGILAPSNIPIPAAVWNSLIGKLRKEAPDTNAIHSLSRLNHCFMAKQCKTEDGHWLSEAYDAALSHPIANVGLLGVHGEYAWHVLDDRALAEQDYREVWRRHPADIEALMNLIVVLIHRGKLQEAEMMTDQLDQRNYLGSLDSYVNPLRATILKAKNSADTKADSH